MQVRGRYPVSYWDSGSGGGEDADGGIVYLNGWWCFEGEAASGAARAKGRGGEGTLNVGLGELGEQDAFSEEESLREDVERMLQVRARLSGLPPEAACGTEGKEGGGVEAEAYFWSAPRRPHRTLLLYHHLGLGDHIVCYGLVRSLAASWPLVLVPVHSKYLTSFQHMYKGVPNVRPYAVEDEYTVMRENDRFFLDAGVQPLRLGYHRSLANTDALLAGGVSFAEVFYLHAGVPYGQRWALWNVERDRQREAEVKAASGVSDWGSYAFVHDDPSRGFILDRSGVRPGLRCYHPNEGLALSWNIFDYGAMIEGAEELHLMDSSFALLAEHLDLSRVRRKALHVYARLNEDGRAQVAGHQVLYRQGWELLHVPEGGGHLGVSVDHPSEGDVLWPGMEQPPEYQAARYRRLTVSIRDAAPLPPAGLVLRVWVDGTLALSFGLANPASPPYRRGACLYAVEGRTPSMEPLHGRCEMDITLPELGPWEHAVRAELLRPDGAGGSTASEVHFTIAVGGGGGSSPAEEPGEEGEEQGHLVVPQSYGEVVDKLSILAIKRRKLTRSDMQRNVGREYRLLLARLTAHAPEVLAGGFLKELEDVNGRLWEVEDDLRRHEAMQSFGVSFTQLARMVYKLNDERGRIKRRVNDEMGSKLTEEKLYARY